MKVSHILTSAILVIALISATWVVAYRKGSEDTASRESKAWEALLASGTLDGILHNIFYWGDKVTAEEAEYIAKDYKELYERFLAARAKVPKDSVANWLMENHTHGKKKPDDFHAILLQYQTRSLPKDDAGAEDKPEGEQAAPSNH